MVMNQFGQDDHAVMLNWMISS